MIKLHKICLLDTILLNSGTQFVITKMEVEQRNNDIEYTFYDPFGTPYDFTQSKHNIKKVLPNDWRFDD